MRAPEGVEEEQEKELLVAMPDAIVDPGAVVIHLEDTNPAHTTMVRPVRFVPSRPENAQKSNVSQNKHQNPKGHPNCQGHTSVCAKCQTLPDVETSEVLAQQATLHDLIPSHG